MRRLGITLAASALLLSACTGKEEPDDPATQESTEQGSTQESSAPDSSAQESTGDADSTKGTDPAETTGEAGATSEGPAASEGAATTEEPLTEAGVLSAGVVSLGPVGPKEQEVNLAICDYVFGAPEEVAAAFGVDGEVALGADSGYEQLGGGGNGPECLYTVDGEEALVVALWNKEREVADDAERFVLQTEVSTGFFGLMAVNPEWGELTVVEATATAWLEDAATRWDGASV